MEVILTHLRKIRNTQLRFVFLNFLSCVKITSVGLKLDRPRCTIGYCYNISLPRDLVYHYLNFNIPLVNVVLLHIVASFFVE